MYEEKIAAINQLCKYADNLSIDFTIAFITSHKEKTTNNSDYTTFSVKSEFYSDELQNKIVEAFKRCNFSVMEFFNEEDFIAYAIKASKKELKRIIVINSAQKGTNIGRKSLIPAFCELYNIHYIGSNPYVVSLCRDKYRCGNILEQNNIKTPKAWLYNPQIGWVNGSPEHFEKKIILKPNYESSSIGVNQDSIGYFNSEFNKKVEEYSKDFNQDIIVEEFISGYEVETPIICIKKPLYFFPIGIEKNNSQYIGDEILDYISRAANKYSLYNFEQYNSSLSKQLINTALRTTYLLNIKGFGRVDYRITKDGDFYVTDVSTNPHYTEKSSFFFPYSNMGMDYDHMIKCLISTAWEDIKNADTHFES